MKVGILTFHHTTNYGATLQAYALGWAVRQQGHSVELIDYRPYKAIQKYLMSLYYFNPHCISNLAKSWRMDQFLNSKMALSAGRCYRQQKLKRWGQNYDLVICGSDEIWNINSFRGFDASYFLDFVDDNTTRRASYAASFGFTASLGQHQLEIQELIQQFDAIAVRDNNSLRIIEEECCAKAIKVLDPTFLADYGDITELPQHRDYVLVYGGINEKQSAYVKALAEQQSLTIIAIGYPCKVAHINLPAVSPGQWLGYFQQASYVFTSFYHGTIFSILFKKPFTVFARADKSVKLKDLLGDLELESRLLTEDAIALAPIPTLTAVDYASVEARLAPLLQHSKTYLFNTLNKTTNLCPL
jgi:Polysaccharide pyruvyl transferase